jgi:uncharacterized protein YndB with AHSA1/START domain
VSAAPDDLVLAQRSELDAPVGTVFRALVEPTLLTKWWGPAGFTTPEIALDLRVGGAYRFGMRPPDGDLFHLAGEFLEVDAPRRLSYTFRWEEPAPDDRETVVTLTLEGHDGGTEIALEHGVFATEERLELHRNGWTDALVKLRDLVTSEPR